MWRYPDERIRHDEMTGEYIIGQEIEGKHGKIKLVRPAKNPDIWEIYLNDGSKYWTHWTDVALRVIDHGGKKSKAYIHKL